MINPGANGFKKVKRSSMNKILIFLRKPVVGKVKTRLAKTLGDESSLEIYKKLSGHAIRSTNGIDAKILLYYDSEPGTNNHQEFEIKIQEGESLGERMKQAFQGELPGKVLLIGSDVPGLRLDIFNFAFDLLEYSDLVLGPTLDGGFYLIGMKEDHTDVLGNVDWSTEHAMADVTANAVGKNLKLGLTELLRDIDTEEDYWSLKGLMDKME